MIRRDPQVLENGVLMTTIGGWRTGYGQLSKVKERAHHGGLRLLMEGSVLGLVLGAWLWGILTFGAHHAVAAQTPSSGGEHLPGYVLACPSVHSPEEGVGSVGGDSSGCVGEVRSHTSTTRQPGTSLAKQRHRGDT